jgi:hypothetical protein
MRKVKATLVLLLNALLLGGAACSAQSGSAASSNAKPFGLLGELTFAGYVVRLSSSPAAPV